jgi:hypothetical protein
MGGLSGVGPKPEHLLSLRALWLQGLLVTARIYLQFLLPRASLPASRRISDTIGT